MSQSTEIVFSISLSRNIIPLIGLSVYFRDQNKINIYDFSDTPSFENLTKQIKHFKPTKILIPENQDIFLYFLELCSKNLNVIKLTRDCFEDEADKFLTGCDFFTMVRNKYFVVTSINALITHLKINFRNEDIYYDRIPGICFLTNESIINLELLNSSENGKSLFDTINNTKTKMGRRRLKLNLIQPFYNAEKIKERQDNVRFLNENPELSIKIAKALESYVDIDQIIIDNVVIRCETLEDQLNIIINSLKTRFLLESTLNLQDLLDNDKFINMEFIQGLKTAITQKGVIEAYNLVKEILNDDVEYRENIKLFPKTLVSSLKKTIDPFLEIAIEIFNENIIDIEEEYENITKGLNMKSELVYDWEQGYLLKIKNKDFQELNKNREEFIRVLNSDNENFNYKINSQMFNPEDNKKIAQNSGSKNYNHLNFQTFNTYTTNTTKSSIISEENNNNRISLESIYEDEISNSKPSKNKNDTFLNRNLDFILLKKQKDTVFLSTIEMHKLNSRIQTSLEQVVQIGHIYCMRLLGKIRSSYGTFMKISEKISELDIINSLYSYGIQEESTLPEIGDSILISKSSHPLFDKFDRISNNIYASPKLHFNIITGCNMNGKTIYAKGIAINVILSQIGSPIRAHYAKIRLFENISTRIKHDGNTEERLSTYEHEIYEIKKIMDSANQNTLIIIDELGRGSTYYDGTALALVTCQELLIKGSYVFFITHFLEIINYLKHHTNVNVLKCDNFSVTSGVCQKTQGIELCIDLFPKKIIDDAIIIKNRISKRINNVIFRNSKVQLALMIMECKEEDKKEMKKKLQEIMIIK